MQYNQHAWLRKIDEAITTKASVQHSTSKGKTVSLTMSISAGFIAYHLAEKRADWETGKGVYCSQAKLAEEFGMSRQTISNVFIILEKLGFFIRDLSKEKTGGANYYDLAIPDPVLSQDMGVLSQDRGCLVAGQGVSSHETQTTNRTTQGTNKEKTKVSRPAGGAATPPEVSLSSNRRTPSINPKDISSSIGQTESAGGVLSEDRVAKSDSAGRESLKDETYARVLEYRKKQAEYVVQKSEPVAADNLTQEEREEIVW